MSATTASTEARQPRVPTAGWRVIAAKELGDHLLSIRFIVLLVVLGLAVAIPLYFAADLIRDAAPQASGAPAIFLALFTVGSQDYTFLRVASFVAIVAPLLGLAFAFDAVNGERADGTLPRLLAQPIYRDDVINGKFVAGLAVIAVVLVAVIGIIAGYGIVRLGITPASEEVVRLVSWLFVTFVYVGLWLSFGLLLSVLFRRAATSALIGFGVWFTLTTFGPLITSLIGRTLSPLTGSTVAEQIGQAQTQQFISRLLPSQLYSEVTARPAQPEPEPRAGPAGLAGAGPAGRPADPDALRVRPEPAPRLAADRRARRPDGRLLRTCLRRVHAPGSPRVRAAAVVLSFRERRRR